MLTFARGRCDVEHIRLARGAHTLSHSMSSEYSGKDANLGRPLVNPPNDGITALRFSANSDLLLCASWDGVGAAFR